MSDKLTFEKMNDAITKSYNASKEHNINPCRICTPAEQRLTEYLTDLSNEISTEDVEFLLMREEMANCFREKLWDEGFGSEEHMRKCTLLKRFTDETKNLWVEWSKEGDK